MVTVEVEGVGMLVFIEDYDCDWSSAMYRMGAHSVSGPYLLID